MRDMWSFLAGRKVKVHDPRMRACSRHFHAPPLPTDVPTLYLPPPGQRRSKYPEQEVLRQRIPEARLAVFAKYLLLFPHLLDAVNVWRKLVRPHVWSESAVARARRRPPACGLAQADDMLHLVDYIMHRDHLSQYWELLDEIAASVPNGKCAELAEKYGVDQIRVQTVWDLFCSGVRMKLQWLSCVGDRWDKLPRAALLSPAEWANSGAVIMDLDHVEWAVVYTALLGRPTHLLLVLAATYNLDDRTAPRDLRQRRWATAYRNYNKSGLRCPFVLLQRRWHQLKQDARRAVRRQRTLRPHPYHWELLARWPHVATEPLPTWRELRQQGFVYELTEDQLDMLEDVEPEHGDVSEDFCGLSTNHISGWPQTRIDNDTAKPVLNMNSTNPMVQIRNVIEDLKELNAALKHSKQHLYRLNVLDRETRPTITLTHSEHGPISLENAKTSEDMDTIVNLESLDPSKVKTTILFESDEETISVCDNNSGIEERTESKRQNDDDDILEIAVRYPLQALKRAKLENDSIPNDTGIVITNIRSELIVDEVQDDISMSKNSEGVKKEKDNDIDVPVSKSSEFNGDKVKDDICMSNNSVVVKKEKDNDIDVPVSKSSEFNGDKVKGDISMSNNSVVVKKEKDSDIDLPVPKSRKRIMFEDSSDTSGSDADSECSNDDIEVDEKLLMDTKVILERIDSEKNLLFFDRSRKTHTEQPKPVEESNQSIAIQSLKTRIISDLLSETLAPKSEPAEPVKSLDLLSEPLAEMSEPAEPVKSLDLLSVPLAEKSEPADPVKPLDLLSEPLAEKSEPAEPVKPLNLLSEPAEPVKPLDLLSEPLAEKPEPAEPVKSLDLLSEPLAEMSEPAEPLKPLDLLSEPLAKKSEPAEPVKSLDLLSEPLAEMSEPAEPVKSLDLLSEPLAEKSEPTEPVKSVFEPYPMDLDTKIDITSPIQPEKSIFKPDPMDIGTNEDVTEPIRTVTSPIPIESDSDSDDLEIFIIGTSNLKPKILNELETADSQISHESKNAETLKLGDNQSEKNHPPSTSNELSSEDEPLIYKSKQRTYENQQILSKTGQISSENEQILSENQQIPSENQQIPSDNQQIASENQQMLSENRQISSENQQISSENQQISFDNQQLLLERKHSSSTSSESIQLQSENEQFPSEHNQMSSENKLPSETSPSPSESGHCPGAPSGVSGTAEELLKLCRPLSVVLHKLTPQDYAKTWAWAARRPVRLPTRGRARLLPVAQVKPIRPAPGDSAPDDTGKGVCSVKELHDRIQEGLNKPEDDIVAKYPLFNTATIASSGDESDEGSVEKAKNNKAPISKARKRKKKTEDVTLESNEERVTSGDADYDEWLRQRNQFKKYFFIKSMIGKSKFKNQETVEAEAVVATLPNNLPEPLTEQTISQSNITPEQSYERYAPAPNEPMPDPLMVIADMIERSYRDGEQSKKLEDVLQVAYTPQEMVETVAPLRVAPLTVENLAFHTQTQSLHAAGPSNTKLNRQISSIEIKQLNLYKQNIHPYMKMNPQNKSILKTANVQNKAIPNTTNIRNNAIPNTSDIQNNAIQNTTNIQNNAIQNTTNIQNKAIPNVTNIRNNAIPNTIGFQNNAIPSTSQNFAPNIPTRMRLDAVASPVQPVFNINQGFSRYPTTYSLLKANNPAAKANTHLAQVVTMPKVLQKTQANVEGGKQYLVLKTSHSYLNPKNKNRVSDDGNMPLVLQNYNVDRHTVVPAQINLENQVSPSTSETNKVAEVIKRITSTVNQQKRIINTVNQRLRFANTANQQQHITGSLNPQQYITGSVNSQQHITGSLNPQQYIANTVNRQQHITNKINQQQDRNLKPIHITSDSKGTISNRIEIEGDVPKDKDFYVQIPTTSENQTQPLIIRVNRPNPNLSEEQNYFFISPENNTSDNPQNTKLNSANNNEMNININQYKFKQHVILKMKHNNATTDKNSDINEPTATADHDSNRNESIQDTSDLVDARNNPQMLRKVAYPFVSNIVGRVGSVSMLTCGVDFEDAESKANPSEPNLEFSENSEAVDDGRDSPDVVMLPPEEPDVVDLTEDDLESTEIRDKCDYYTVPHSMPVLESEEIVNSGLQSGGMPVLESEEIVNSGLQSGGTYTVA